MTRDFRLPRAYKTLLAIAVAVGPIAWLLFSADGQRRTDLALMFLLGRPAFDAALDRFSPRLDEPRLRARFPGLSLDCAPDPSPFGDRRCTAVLGSFNQYPAQAVTFYFRGDALAALDVRYQPAYHAAIRAWVERRPGRMRSGDRPLEPRVAQGVASWPVAEGLLVMRDGPLGAGDAPALWWLAAGPSRPSAP